MSQETFTIGFCGTSCTTEEGDANSRGSYMVKVPKIGGEDQESGAVLEREYHTVHVGYLPNRLLNLLKDRGKGFLISGAGQAYVGADGRQVDVGTAEAAQGYSVGARIDEAVASARAYYRSRSGRAVKVVNIIGHSRGAVEAICATWKIQAAIPSAIVNVFALDPVPGGTSTGAWAGLWYGQLCENVRNYIGIYARDEMSVGFTPVVPWPTKHQQSKFTGTLNGSWNPLNTLAYAFHPLSEAYGSGRAGHVPNYHLIASRGSHGTVTGNCNIDGNLGQIFKNRKGVERQTSLATASPGALTYHLALQKLSQWGTEFSDTAVGEVDPAKLGGFAKLCSSIGGADRVFTDMRNTLRTIGTPFRTTWSVESQERNIYRRGDARNTSLEQVISKGMVKWDKLEALDVGHFERETKKWDCDEDWGGIVLSGPREPSPGTPKYVGDSLEPREH